LQRLELNERNVRNLAHETNKNRKAQTVSKLDHIIRKEGNDGYDALESREPLSKPKSDLTLNLVSESTVAQDMINKMKLETKASLMKPFNEDKRISVIKEDEKLPNMQRALNRRSTVRRKSVNHDSEEKLDMSNYDDKKGIELNEKRNVSKFSGEKFKPYQETDSKSGF